MHIEADNPAIAGRIREYFVNMAAGKSLSRDFHLAQMERREGARGDKRDEIRKGRWRTRFPASGVARVSVK